MKTSFGMGLSGRFLTAWALTAAGLLPATASRHIVDIVWDASGRFETSTTAAPGRFVEVCGALRPGDLVRWSFKAAAPLEFNVHHHVGQVTEYATKRARVGHGEGELRAPVEETYCWMWTNKSGRPVRVDLRLSR